MKELLILVCLLISTHAKQNDLTGLSFGCGNVTLSCSPDMLLVVERVSYIHGTECEEEEKEKEERMEEKSTNQLDLTYKNYIDAAQSLHREYRDTSKQYNHVPTLEELHGVHEPVYEPPLISELVSEDSVDVWDAVLSKCSGYEKGNCPFNIGTQLPHFSSRGRLEVQYTCAEDVYSYCGGQIQSGSGGYLSSPGYPKYYLGGRSCLWNITGGEGQRIEVSLLDTSLRTEDCVEIQVGRRTEARECGRLAEIKRVISTGNFIQIRTIISASSQQILSRRGILLRYKTIGCSAPAPIADGRISMFNGSFAEFTCDQGHVFKSSLATVKTVQCRGNVWSESLEHCISVDFLLQYGGEDVKNALTFTHSQLTQPDIERSGEWKVEVVGTTLVGVLLLVSLSIGVLLYCKYSESGSYHLQDDQLSLKEVESGFPEPKQERY